MTTFNKEKRFYVYAKMIEDRVIYIGKGTGGRDQVQDRGELYNLLTQDREVETTRLYDNLSEHEAFTAEAKMIRKYNPAFNGNNGLTEAKWIKVESTKKSDILPEESETPETIAKEMVENIKANDYKNVLLLDRYGKIWIEFKKRFPNFKGQVTVIEKQQDRLPGFDNVAYRVVPDFLEHDFSGEHFDLILMNPPFTKGTDKMLWKKFLNKAIEMADTVSFLAPVGAMGAAFYGDKKYGISYIRQVASSEVGIQKECAIGIWTKTPTGTVEVPGYGMIDIAKYPYEVPRIKYMTIGTYDELFCQNEGLRITTSRKHHIKDKTYGMARVDGELVSGRHNELYKVNGQTTMSFIPCDKKTANRIIKRFNKAIEEGRFSFNPRGKFMRTMDDRDITMIRA